MLMFQPTSMRSAGGKAVAYEERAAVDDLPVAILRDGRLQRPLRLRPFLLRELKSSWLGGAESSVSNHEAVDGRACKVQCDTVGASACIVPVCGLPLQITSIGSATGFLLSGRRAAG